jgi:hypothetical protein
MLRTDALVEGPLGGLGIVGNYLTTLGRDSAEDLALLDELHADQGAQHDRVTDRDGHVEEHIDIRSAMR